MLSHKNKKLLLGLLLLGFGILCIYVAYQLGQVKGLERNIYRLNQQSQKAGQLQSVSTSYSDLYSVVHIVDGDTIDIGIENKKVRIRLLGVNTPEYVDQNRPVECYAKEASQYLKELLTDRKVTIELDPNKPEKDQYGRVLAYVVRDDGLFVNKTIIEQGYGYEYTYRSEQYKHQEEFKRVEDTAKSLGSGLWSSSTCNGKK